LQAGKNNGFKGAIRIFVTPKNDGIDVILSQASLGTKDVYFFKSSFTSLREIDRGL
jgi:hypothetical protein